jgi:hypothetical protein
VIRRLFVGGAILVLPLLGALTLPQPFHSVGPLGDAWWILLVTTAVGAGVLVTAYVSLTRLLLRAARAVTLGYGWVTTALVAADGDRDMGFLLQGAREYALFGDSTRRILRAMRLVRACALLAASLWLSVGFALGLLLAAGGSMSPMGLVALTLAPVVLLPMPGVALRAFEGTLLRRARREWHGRPEAHLHDREEGRRWMADMGAMDDVAMQPGSRRSAILLRLGAAVVILAALFVIVPAATVAGTSSISPVLAMIALPRFGSTQRRAAESEPLRRYALPADAAVGPQEAGEILHVLTYVGRDGRARAGELAPARVYPDAYFDNRGRDNPTGLFPEQWSDDLFGRLRDPSPEEVAYLRRVAAHPALLEFSRLARASELDAAGARWTRPFTPGTTPAGIATPMFSPVREASSAQIARAAVAAVEGRRDEAERLLRETISVGLLMGDRGPTLIENLIGFVVAARGGRALSAFYRFTGRTEEADELEWAMDVAASAAERASVLRGSTPLATLGEIPAFVTDTTTVRGLRWEYFAVLNTLSPCLNLNRIVFGPDPAYSEWLETAHESLVDWPSDEPLFELMRLGWFGRVGGPSEPTFLTRLLGMTVHRGNDPGSCRPVLHEIERIPRMLP